MIWAIETPNNQFNIICGPDHTRLGPNRCSECRVSASGKVTVCFLDGGRLAERQADEDAVISDANESSFALHAVCSVAGYAGIIT
jgi:hypothetical protein